jgi:hypothetical protein
MALRPQASGSKVLPLGQAGLAQPDFLGPLRHVYE